jgi:hypothetical protein
MYRGPPFLRSFTLFPKLPLEIRMMIWKQTLQPRDIEIYFAPNRGFFTPIWGPVALRVNKESRNTVEPLYPLSFGNVVYQPRVRFNFSIDTLFLEHDFQPQVLHFLASLKPYEITQLRYLAVDMLIDIDFGDGEHVEIDTEKVIQKAIPAMTNLKEIRIIISLEYLPEGDVSHPSGEGAMELYDEMWPDFLRKFHLDMCECPCRYSPADFTDHDFDDEFGCCDHECNCMELPLVDGNWARLEGLTVCSAWGWRPIYFEY